MKRSDIQFTRQHPPGYGVVNSCAENRRLFISPLHEIATRIWLAAVVAWFGFLSGFIFLFVYLLLA